MEKANFDFVESLWEALEDEAADIEKYMKMASVACDDPDTAKYAPILRDIAKEESVHHKHIKSILCDMGLWEKGGSVDSAHSHEGNVESDNEESEDDEE